jgi:crossover junction endodeoxyribonuclease RuvC
MKILGIDPGIAAGGLAIIEANNVTMTDALNTSVTMTVIDAIDIPTIGTKAKERVDVIAIQKWIAQHRPALACIERAQAMPKQGASSGFKYGKATGAIEAAVALSGIPLEIIEPSVWKRALHLPGKDKERSRQLALELFPAAHALLARKKDHGRAEAALIALYGTRNSRLLTAPPGAQPGFNDETNPTVGANLNE